MANNVITELDQQLASLNQLKPPGASKSKIQSITTLCVNNIQVSTTSQRRQIQDAAGALERVVHVDPKQY